MGEVGSKDLAYEKRMAWFHEARFGMVIHWGLYSLFERGEWVMFVERMRKKEYAKLANRFKPPKSFNPESWVNLAKNSGMKYMVLTTRHHDGFCLFDSKVSDFTSVKTAAKRDIIAEYISACRRHGIKVGLYYSLLDWRFDGWHNVKKYPDSAEAMIKQAHEQVRELMTNYGKIDLLWYDGGWMHGIKDIIKFWRAKELNKMVRQLQPEILINNRSGLNEDIDTPEQHVTASAPGRGWESCMTMGDFCGWGYIKHNPNFKSATQLIQHLVMAASRAGNYLLNIGPKADGSVRVEETKRLKEIGAWLKVNGESIYNSERLPDGWGGIYPEPFFGAGIVGPATAKGNIIYLHIFRWAGKTLTVPGVKSRVVSARLLATGKDVKIKQTSDGIVTITGLPEAPPDKHDTVIALKFDGKPEAYSYSGITL